MPFYLKKSISAGPFRFNFAKGGVGVSVGVKGLRIGTGPRGHYVHAGCGGICYRASIGRAGQRLRTSEQTPSRCTSSNAGVEMIEIESGNVLEMRDEVFSDLLDDINSKHTQSRMSYLLTWSFLILALLTAIWLGSDGLYVFILALPAWAIGRWIDSYRRVSILFYDLSRDVEVAYKSATSGFDSMMSCACTWHIEAGGTIRDLATWKRNAGASYLVERKPTVLDYRLPAVVRSNIVPPAMKVGKQTLYFFPDVCLVEDGKHVGAVGYADLNLRWQDARFIEEQAVPKDAQIIDYTWKYPNKKVGPDRRFKDNREIPICLYEALYLNSENGLNELVEFSRTGVAQSFASAIGLLPKQSATTIQLSLSK